MKKVIYILFIFSLFYSSVDALELGPIKMDSYLNEPLSASFTLNQIDAENLGDIILSLADQKAYQSIGLDKPHFLTSLKFNITAGQGTRHVVNISTRQRIREPILDVLVKVSGKQTNLSRLYTLMVDPRVIGNLKLTKKTPVVDSPSQQKITKSTQNQPVKSSSNRVQVANESISIIAQNSPLHDKYSVYQIMRAFYLLNTSAFYRGNINNLQSASSLIIPEESLVGEVSRQKSVNFVYAASKNEPFKIKSTVQQKEIIQDTHEKTPVIVQTKLNETKLSNNESPAGKTVRLKSSPLINQRMVDDVKTWRTVAEEFKSLSSVVENQNGAMKVLSAVIKDMNIQLEKTNQQIELVNFRLQALETGNSVAATGSEKLASDDFQTQNNTILQQGISIDGINQSLTQGLDEMSRINLRLDVLERLEQESIPQVNSNSAKPINALNNVQVNSGNETNRVNNSFWWLLASIVVASLIILGREKLWRQRLKAVSIHDNNVKNEQTISRQEVEKVVEDKKEAVIEETLIDTLEFVAPELVVSNQKMADQKYEAAVHKARKFKLSPAAGVQPVADKEVNAESLYQEIDVLIAYQLYDEALEMLKTARETMQDNGCLDIRELEILAYTKNVDLFFPKLEKDKQWLSVEFPKEWENIVKLGDKLSAECQHTAAM